MPVPPLSHVMRDHATRKSSAVSAECCLLCHVQMIEQRNEIAQMTTTQLVVYSNEMTIDDSEIFVDHTMLFAIKT